MKISVRTFDSMTRRASRSTVDTILAAATEAELAEYFSGRAKLDPGRVWDGYFKPMLDAMDPRTRDEVLSNLSDYAPSMSSGAMRPGPAGSLASTGGDPLGKARSNTSDGSLARGSLRQWRDATAKVVDDINSRNREFYGQPSVRW